MAERGMCYSMLLWDDVNYEMFAASNTEGMRWQAAGWPE